MARLATAEKNSKIIGLVASLPHNFASSSSQKMDKAQQAPLSSQEYLEPIVAWLALCDLGSVTESAIIKDLLLQIGDPVKREEYREGLVASTSLSRFMKTLMNYGMLLCESIETLLKEIPNGDLHAYLTHLMQYFDQLIINDEVNRSIFFACVEGKENPRQWRKSLRNALFHGHILPFRING